MRLDDPKRFPDPQRQRTLFLSLQKGTPYSPHTLCWPRESATHKQQRQAAVCTLFCLHSVLFALFSRLVWWSAHSNAHVRYALYCGLVTFISSRAVKKFFGLPVARQVNRLAECRRCSPEKDAQPWCKSSFLTLHCHKRGTSYQANA